MNRAPESSNRRALGTAIMAFVLLGLPMAALGVAWPSMASDLNRPIADLSVLIVAHVIGYFLVATINGELTRRIGGGRLLTGAAVVATLGLTAVAISPTWTWVVVAVAALGVAGGLIDAGLNAYVAVAHGANAMGILHAGFGIGAVIGPLVVTASLALGASWQAGFAIAAVAQAAVAVALYVTRSRFGRVRPPVGEDRARPTGHRGRLVLSLLIFGLYAGVEVGAGEWSFALFTEGRGMNATAGGIVVAGYWAALTLSRIGLGVIGDRGRSRTVLLVSSAVAAAGLFLLWWAPRLWVGAAGLLLTGFAFGPYFPIQMLLTPVRFGHAFMPWMSGYQLAAASIGAAVIPGVIGVLVASAGLESVAAVLALASIPLIFATALLDRPVFSPSG